MDPVENNIVQPVKPVDETTVPFGTQPDKDAVEAQPVLPGNVNAAPALLGDIWRTGSGVIKVASGDGATGLPVVYTGEVAFAQDAGPASYQPVCGDPPGDTPGQDEDLNPRKLAEELMKQGDFERAEKHLRLDISALEQRLGKDSVEVGNARYNLAHFFNEQGRYADAQTELTKSIAVFEKLPESHPLKKPALALALGDQGALWLREAADLKKAGKSEAAVSKVQEVEKAYTKAIEYLEGIKSPAMTKMFEPGLKQAYLDYAWLLDHSDRKDKAKEYKDKADKLSDKPIDQAEFEKLMAKEMPAQGSGAAMKKLQSSLDGIEERAKAAQTPADREKVVAELKEQVRILDCIELKLPLNTPLEKVETEKRTRLGLPVSASDSELSRAREAKHLGLDPVKATEKEIKEARDWQNHERSCKFFKLDPKTTTKEQVNQAYERLSFENSCRTHGLDPQKATKQDLETARKKSEFEWSCKTYGLDPKTATKEQLDTTREHYSSCYLFGIDPKAKDSEQLVHKELCKMFKLPETATKKDIEAKREAQRQEYLKRRKELEDDPWRFNRELDYPRN